ncbi:hypothetical protein MXZ23_05570 [Streptococcus uberis]|uniref:Lin0368 family putative glycerol transporter subunit n=1 Tax=Streptococcus uberis TaxID=1349 RepID=UPI0027DD3DC2|nr:hypothetical protein [Streptococcus uberis]MCK1193061.1 hypothetical protein [Streptococcus uberis]
MTFLRSILAYFFAAMMINIFWPLLATPFGPYAGFIAGALVIGPTWFICHYKGFISQGKHLALDMGGAIATSVLVKTALNAGFSESLAALPTFLAIIIGAILAGWFYWKIEGAEK